MKTRLLAMMLFGGLFVGANAQTAPRLIPFQGRLTDQNNVVYTNGSYTIIFTLYDQPVGGTLLWNERHEKVGLLNGMVNVFLGSIRSFDNPGGTYQPVKFSQTRYLGITIDTDHNASTPDPEMIPRQMIIPSFWAKTADSSEKMSGYDWSALFGVNDPTIALPGSKLASNSVPFNRMAIRNTANPAGPGNIAVSELTTSASITESQGVQPLGNLTVTITTTGRPLVIAIVPDTDGTNGDSNLAVGRQTPGGNWVQHLAVVTTRVRVREAGTDILSWDYQSPSWFNYAVPIPPSSFWGVTTLPAGQHTFTVYADANVRIPPQGTQIINPDPIAPLPHPGTDYQPGVQAFIVVNQVRLIAFEL